MTVSDPRTETSATRVTPVTLRAVATPTPAGKARKEAATAAEAATGDTAAAPAATTVTLAADVLVGLVIDALHLAQAAQRQASALTESFKPLLPLLLRPPLVPRRFWPESLLTAASARWQGERASLERTAAEQFSVLVPRLLEAILDQVDLSEIVMEHVDLNEVARTIDADAIVARVDIDAIADRLDLNRAIKRVDVNAVVALADLDAAATRINIDRILDRVDLVGIARTLLDELDLPEIIRQSSGSMASDAVRGVRLQSMEADQRVSRGLDRLLLRRDRRAIADGTGGVPTDAGHAVT